MTAATFHTPVAVPKASKVRSDPAPGFFARLLDAMMEARLRQAMREIGRHRHLVPENLAKKYGYKATLTDDSKLPFTR